tara:strand:- start:225 stop:1187 length:963 start_codon:yes stop_codon:yes gene_type:complete
MLNILVTGGTGFIGSHLCQKLLTQGHHVICLDNNFTGSLNNIKSFRDHHRFEFIRHDVTEKILLEVDQIYHLACPASPKSYQYNAIKTIKTNVVGTLNMLGLAKRVDARILLTSTSEVYGDPQVSPQKEEYWGHVNPIGIRSCYDEGKRVAETLMMEYHRNHGVDTRIARIFNTYGPRLHHDDGRVISNFIVQALKNQNITIYGQGTQTRSFCFVSDTVEGLIRLMNLDSYHLPVNIGNPVEHTIREIGEKIIKMVREYNSKERKEIQSILEFGEMPSDDPTQRKPDIERAKKLLKWMPTVSLDKGLMETIKYFSNLLVI